MTSYLSSRPMLLAPDHVSGLKPLTREERQCCQTELRERAYQLAGAQVIDEMDRRLPPIVNGVGVLLLVGELSNEGSYYGTSLIRFQEQLAMLVDDSTVRRIILYVDSPGGDYVGTPETAAAITAATKVKQVDSFTNGSMASGAYWASSAASSIVATPSANGIGSIGAYLLHSDYSAYFESLGIVNTIIRKPAGKAAFNPFEPLDDETKDWAQDRIDAIAKEFYAAVARQRKGKMGVLDVVKTNARVFSAPEAKELGLIDKIEPWPSFLARVQGEAKAARLQRVESLHPALRAAALKGFARLGLVDVADPPRAPTADEIAASLNALNSN